jgi:hypothetical protein
MSKERKKHDCLWQKRDLLLAWSRFMKIKHPFVSTDGDEAWYPQACRFLRLSHHHLHSPFEKSLVERTIQ